MTVQLTGRELTLPEVVAVARGGSRVSLAADAVGRMEASRRVVEELVREGHTVYGVTTGFGDLASVTIDPQQTEELQRNLVRSHAAGTG